MCFGVTCHLQFEQNAQGLALTRGWNRHQIRASTEFSNSSCRESNSLPFEHESGTIPTELSRHPVFFILFYEHRKMSRTIHTTKISCPKCYNNISCEICLGVYNHNSQQYYSFFLSFWSHLNKHVERETNKTKVVDHKEPFEVKRLAVLHKARAHKDKENVEES